MRRDGSKHTDANVVRDSMLPQLRREDGQGGREVKIRCTKEEHAELVASCHAKGSCSGCALENICKMCEQETGKESYQRLTELVEIEEKTSGRGIGELLNDSP